MPLQLADKAIIESDEQLAKLTANGSQSAVQKLLDRYENLLNSKARLYSKSKNDIDDYLQEGKIGLYKAAINFSGDKSVPFPAFAKLCIERQILNAVRRDKKHKNIELISSDDDYADELNIKNTLQNNPEKFVLDKENAAYIKRLIDVLLSAFEYKVLNLYLEGHSYSDIGRKLKRDNKSVDNAISRIKKKVAMNLDSSCS